MNTRLSLIRSLVWSGHTHCLASDYSRQPSVLGLALRWSRKMSAKRKRVALTLDQKRPLHATQMTLDNFLREQ